MNKKYMWLILSIISLVVLLISIYMSYKTGRTEYAWIIGAMLLGIVSGNKYNKMKKE
ncbi:hypothetical protein [Facklamia sp. P12955]|uniref:hypothetical protein n=1 Tax=Facklamia sp. P12955 TaxID=3421946 RepID=UPI003D172BBF